MASMKQQSQINDLRTRLESVEIALGQIIAEKDMVADLAAAQETKKKPAKKRAKNGTV